MRKCVVGAQEVNVHIMELQVFGWGLAHLISQQPTNFLILSALSITPKYVLYCHKEPSQQNLKWTQLYRLSSSLS